MRGQTRAFIWTATVCAPLGTVLCATALAAPHLSIKTPATVKAGTGFIAKIRGKTSKRYHRVAFASDEGSCASTYVAERSRPGGKQDFRYTSFPPRRRFLLHVQFHKSNTAGAPRTQWVCAYLIENRKTGKTGAAASKSYQVS